MCCTVVLFVGQRFVGCLLQNNLLQGSNGKGASIALNDSNNNSKNTQSRCENLHNQNFDKQTGILGIGDRTTGSSNSDTDTGSNISQTNRKSSREHSVSSIVVTRIIPVFLQIVSTGFWLLDFVGKDNGHDDTVDSSSFTENDAVGK
jgi:hypothetical protein